MDETVAQRAQRTLAVWDAGGDVRYERWRDTVQELLAALAAAEQARVLVEETLADTAAILQEERDRAEAAEQARDQALTARDYYANRSLEYVTRFMNAEQRATRLAALEAAARAWAAWMEADQTGEDWADVAERLQAAVAALDAPSPGGTVPSQGGR